MSKQSEARAAQGYMLKPRVCGGCKRYRSDMVLPIWAIEMYGPKADDKYKIEKNKRCGLGGFAVGKSACCSKWEAA